MQKNKNMREASQAQIRVHEKANCITSNSNCIANWSTTQLVCQLQINCKKQKQAWFGGREMQNWAQTTENAWINNLILSTDNNEYSIRKSVKNVSPNIGREITFIFQLVKKWCVPFSCFLLCVSALCLPCLSFSVPTPGKQHTHNTHTHTHTQHHHSPEKSSSEVASVTTTKHIQRYKIKFMLALNATSTALKRMCWRQT